MTKEELNGVVWFSDKIRTSIRNWGVDGTAESAGTVYAKLEANIKNELALGRIPPFTTKHALSLSQMIFTCGMWGDYKKIYELHPAFVDYLMDTEDSPITTEIIDKLPFKSYYVYFGPRECKDREVIGMDSVYGMYFRVQVNGKDIRIGIVLQGNNENGKPSALPSVLRFEDGDNFEVIANSSDGYVMGDLANDVVSAAWRPYFRIALNTCQYLCASNAEIHDVKTKKGDRPVVSVNGKSRPVAVQRSEVGFRLGTKFEKLYKKAEAGEQRYDSKGGRPVRPHVRRAHWHHYWTGPGRTVLELRWLEPVFVMGDSEKIDVVVHEVSGEMAG